MGGMGEHIDDARTLENIACFMTQNLCISS